MKKLLLLGTAFFSLLFMTAPQLATASCANPVNNKEAIQCGACDASGQPKCDDGTVAEKTLNETIGTVINILSIIISITAVVMIMLAGFRYITSAGVAEKVASAKNALLYAIIGLVIVALAQVIVHFVLHTTTKAVKTSYSSQPVRG